MRKDNKEGSVRHLRGWCQRFRALVFTFFPITIHMVWQTVLLFPVERLYLPDPLHGRLNPPCGRIIHSYPVELRSSEVICSNQLTNKM